eukprot:285799_1
MHLWLLILRTLVGLLPLVEHCLSLSPRSAKAAVARPPLPSWAQPSSNERGWDLKAVRSPIGWRLSTHDSNGGGMLRDASWSRKPASVTDRSVTAWEKRSSSTLNCHNAGFPKLSSSTEAAVGWPYEGMDETVSGSSMVERCYNDLRAATSRILSKVRAVAKLDGGITEAVLWQAAGELMVPAALVGGCLIAPSRFLAVRAGVGACFAGGASLARQNMVERRRCLAPNAMMKLVQLLGPCNVTWEDLVREGRAYFLSEEEDLPVISVQLYRYALEGIASGDDTPELDLANLRRLKRELRLNDGRVNACHVNLIEDVLSGAFTQTPAMNMDKLLFLSERLAWCEDMGGTKYHSACKHLRRIVGGISQNDLVKRVSSYSSPLYLKALQEMLENPDAFSGEVLLRMRKGLGVSDVAAGAMHLDVYQSRIENIVSVGGRIGEGERTALAKARSTMGVSRFEGERALESVAAPLYRDCLVSVIAEAKELSSVRSTRGSENGGVGATADTRVEALRQRLKDKQADLHLPQSAAESVLKDTVRKLCDVSLSSAVSALRSTKESDGPVLNALEEVFGLKRAVELVWSSSGAPLPSPAPERISGRGTASTSHSPLPSALQGFQLPTNALFRGTLVGGPALRMTQEEKRRIYAAVVRQQLKVDDEADALSRLRETQSFMQLEEKYSTLTHVEVARPIVEKQMNHMIDSHTLTSDSTSFLMKSMLFLISPAQFHDLVMEVYHLRLVNTTKKLSIEDKRGIIISPSDQILEELKGLKYVATAIGLTDEESWTIHDITCEHVYKQLVEVLLQRGRRNQRADISDAGVGNRPVTPKLPELSDAQQLLGMSIQGARCAFLNAFFGTIYPNMHNTIMGIGILGSVQGNHRVGGRKSEAKDRARLADKLGDLAAECEVAGILDDLQMENNGAVSTSRRMFSRVQSENAYRLFLGVALSNDTPDDKAARLRHLIPNTAALLGINTQKAKSLLQDASAYCIQPSEAVLN